VRDRSEAARSQSALKATSKGKKEKKKPKKSAAHDLANGADDPPVAEGSDGEAASKKPVEVTAEDLADEEWGPVKEKAKKGKKGKAKKGKVQEESEDEAKIGAYWKFGRSVQF
jgi:translation initiation factor 5B